MTGNRPACCPPPHPPVPPVPHAAAPPFTECGRPGGAASSGIIEKKPFHNFRNRPYCLKTRKSVQKCIYRFKRRPCASKPAAQGRTLRSDLQHCVNAICNSEHLVLERGFPLSGATDRLLHVRLVVLLLVPEPGVVWTAKKHHERKHVENGVRLRHKQALSVHLAQRRLVPERQESFVPVGGAVPKRVFC